MENEIDRTAVKGLGDIDLLKLKPVVVAQVFEVRELSGQQIVCDHHGIAFRQQRVAQMRAQESGSSGYQGAFSIRHFLSFLVGEAVALAGITGIAARRPTL